jgi:hypothetical protein
MAAGDVTTIKLEPVDVHNKRLMSIANWTTLPDGAVMVKKSDTEISVLEPIADGTITLATTTSITTKYGVIVSKVAS